MTALEDLERQARGLPSGSYVAVPVDTVLKLASVVKAAQEVEYWAVRDAEVFTGRDGLTAALKEL